MRNPHTIEFSFGVGVRRNSDNSKAVLITGSSGFVGQHLVYEFQSAGWQVAGVDIRAPANLSTSNMRLHQCDVADDLILCSIASGNYDAVVHQAAITDTRCRDWTKLVSNNVHKTVALARACLSSDTKLVYASSFSVYGKIFPRRAVSESEAGNAAVSSGPINLYAQSKLYVEEAIQAMAPTLRYIGLRYTNVFGMGEERKGSMASIISQLLAEAATQGHVTVFSDTLEAGRDYIPVSHLAPTIRTVTERPIPSGIYNLGSNLAIEFRELIDWCRQFTDQPHLTVNLVPNPDPASYQYWTCANSSKIRGELPDLPQIGKDVVFAEALKLFKYASVRHVEEQYA